MIDDGLGGKILTYNEVRQTPVTWMARNGTFGSTSYTMYTPMGSGVSQTIYTFWTDQNGTITHWTWRRN